MNDSPSRDEQQIRDALRGIAEAGGPPDEASAWNRVQRGIAVDRTGRNRRILLGGAGLAVAGAAALVLVLGTGDDQEAVEVGPAAETTTTTTAARGEGTASMPARPLAVVVQLEGVQRLDLYDADTGELVVQGLAESPFSISDVSIHGESVLYTEELGDSSTVRGIRWDGSAGPSTPFGIPEDEETRSGVLSPDQTTFAYVEQGVTRTEGRIGLVDTATNEVRYLEWDEAEDDFFLTQGRIDDLAFNADGTRLAFVSTYEGEEIRVVDLDAATLGESIGIAAGVDPAWFGTAAFLYSSSCCYPEFDQPRELRSAVAVRAGSEPDHGDLGAPVSVATLIGGDDEFVLVAIATTDGLVEVRLDGPRTTITVEGTAIEVGL